MKSNGSEENIEAGVMCEYLVQHEKERSNVNFDFYSGSCLSSDALKVV